MCWIVENGFTFHQLIYGYVETYDKNDDEIDRNNDVYFRYEMGTSLNSQFPHDSVEGG